MTGPFFWAGFWSALLESETAATEGGLPGLTVNPVAPGILPNATLILPCISSMWARVRHPCRTGSGKALPNPDLQLQIRSTSLFFSSFHNSFRTLKVSFKGGTEGGLS
jgi:hypothetical protein